MAGGARRGGLFGSPVRDFAPSDVPCPLEYKRLSVAVHAGNLCSAAYCFLQQYLALLGNITSLIGRYMCKFACVLVCLASSQSGAPHGRERAMHAQSDIAHLLQPVCHCGAQLQDSGVSS